HLQVLEDVLVDLGEVVQLEHAGAAAVRGVARRRLRLVGALALQQPLLAVGDVGRVAVAPLAAGLARALRRVHLAIRLALAAFLPAALARAGAVAVAALALTRRAVARRVLRQRRIRPAVLAGIVEDLLRQVAHLLVLGVAGQVLQPLLGLGAVMVGPPAGLVLAAREFRLEVALLRVVLRLTFGHGAAV